MNTPLSFVGNWITSAVLGSVATILVQHVLQRRHTRANRLFDVRYEQYQKYLARLESVSAATNQAFQTTVLQAVPNYLAKILAEPETSDVLLLDMTRDLSTMTARMSEAVSNIQGEIHGLKLVASRPLFAMVQEYTALQSGLFADSARLLSGWRDATQAQGVPIPTPETIAKAERAEAVLQDMIRQMRKELGTDR